MEGAPRTTTTTCDVMRPPPRPPGVPDPHRPRGAPSKEDTARGTMWNNKVLNVLSVSTFDELIGG